MPGLGPGIDWTARHRIDPGRERIAEISRIPTQEGVVEGIVVGGDIVDLEITRSVMIGQEKRAVACRLRHLTDNSNIDKGVGTDRGMEMGIDKIPIPTSRSFTWK